MLEGGQGRDVLHHRRGNEEGSHHAEGEEVRAELFVFVPHLAELRHAALFASYRRYRINI